MISNTQRTLGLLRQQGCIAGVVEKWLNYYSIGRDKQKAIETIIEMIDSNRPMGIRKDLFDFIDIIAMCPNNNRLIGIQSTGQDFAGHDRKILFADKAPLWLLFADLELWGWRRIKKVRGKKAKVWAPRIKRYNLADFGDLICKPEWQFKYEQWLPRITTLLEENKNEDE